MKMIFDFYMEHVKNEVGITQGHPEYEAIAWSVRDALMTRQFMDLFDRRGLFAGFLTWEIRKNKDNPKMIDLGITNLIILKKASGTYCLMRATNRLRALYPNVASFVWKNRKTGEIKTFQQGVKNALIETPINA